MTDDAAGVPLVGGNMNTPVRFGDVVARPAAPWSATTQRLLGHLHARGLTWVPRPAGFDAPGRELVGYLPGEVPRYPLPRWVWDGEILRTSGRMLGDLHTASVDFDRTGAVWQLPVHEPAEVICHNDVAPYNLVFDSGHRVSGLIDWDTASPGPRVWDLAYLAYRLVPLTGPANTDAPWTGGSIRRRRLADLLAAYTAAAGVTVAAVDVLATVATRLIDLAEFTDARAADRPELSAHAVLYRADAAWIPEQGALLS